MIGVLLVSLWVRRAMYAALQPSALSQNDKSNVSFSDIISCSREGFFGAYKCVNDLRSDTCMVEPPPRHVKEAPIDWMLQLRSLLIACVLVAILCWYIRRLWRGSRTRQRHRQVSSAAKCTSSAKSVSKKGGAGKKTANKSMKSNHVFEAARREDEKPLPALPECNQKGPISIPSVVKASSTPDSDQVKNDNKALKPSKMANIKKRKPEVPKSSLPGPNSSAVDSGSSSVNTIKPVSLRANEAASSVPGIKSTTSSLVTAASSKAQRASPAPPVTTMAAALNGHQALTPSSDPPQLLTLEEIQRIQNAAAAAAARSMAPKHGDAKPLRPSMPPKSAWSNPLPWAMDLASKALSPSPGARSVHHETLSVHRETIPDAIPKTYHEFKYNDVGSPRVTPIPSDISETVPTKGAFLGLNPGVALMRQQMLQKMLREEDQKGGAGTPGTISKAGDGGERLSPLKRIINPDLTLSSTRSHGACAFCQGGSVSFAVVHAAKGHLACRQVLANHL